MPTGAALLACPGLLPEDCADAKANVPKISTRRSTLERACVRCNYKWLAVEVLNPRVKCDGSTNADWIETEHLTTVCLIVGRGMKNDFLKSYGSFAEHVVPWTARKFRGAAMKDKDGHTFWRVVLFKKFLDAFKKAAREQGWDNPCDFHFSPEKCFALKASAPQRTASPTTGNISANLVLAVMGSDGSMADYTFTQRPLGFNFAKQSPIVVSSLTPDGQAAKLGLEIGATIAAINGEPIHSQDFTYQYNLLKTCSKGLARRSEAASDNKQSDEQDSHPDIRKCIYQLSDLFFRDRLDRSEIFDQLTILCMHWLFRADYKISRVIDVIDEKLQDLVEEGTRPSPEELRHLIKLTMERQLDKV
eukprot:gnl/TRDRNA2_/TRDRNA2_61670_c0_seq1.p1 gnl/TRDRNA2_/TRDRNA2_61670_c0~~gnl/TRDRNA2_/TRDRNA2_61670_c0_seq1.p1  ORF type:complete len:370 (-),score=57.33 gnl/TRDRNA2_/TRDRNA2_61670_c0_seq1:128-1210(-)